MPRFAEIFSGDAGSTIMADYRELHSQGAEVPDTVPTEVALMVDIPAVRRPSATPVEIDETVREK